MRFDVTITDPDRKLDFTLALECSYRGYSRPRLGWNDGGEPGEPAAIEIERARCLEIVVWCEKQGVAACPGLADDARLESQVGAWCLDHYAEEIEHAVQEQIESHHERIAV
ncbi:MAG: hypothetical protein EXS05_18070 [Planctomycetaceae bacterium]|nr:hypothetical protein [Planctomycetaceae bacterium]